MHIRLKFHKIPTLFTFSFFTHPTKKVPSEGYTVLHAGSGLISYDGRALCRWAPNIDLGRNLTRPSFLVPTCYVPVSVSQEYHGMPAKHEECSILVERLYFFNLVLNFINLVLNFYNFSTKLNLVVL
jgi:hypothetical protein